MYDFISGILSELTPSYAVIETSNGIGWFINISLNTFSTIENLEQGNSKIKLYVHHIIRENEQLLFGFADKTEREIFRLLIDVSGIGPNTARVILSSMSPDELKSAVLSEDAKLISRVKGIGSKTAQRLVIDLKDKITKLGTNDIVIRTSTNNISAKSEEAISALVMLGYQKQAAEKVVKQISTENPSMTTEDLIKYALRNVK